MKPYLMHSFSLSTNPFWRISVFILLPLPKWEGQKGARRSSKEYGRITWTISNKSFPYNYIQINAPPKQIKGLSLIKEYFSDFGYLQSSTPFNVSLDEETITAIKTYQQYFKLQPTGNLNNETIQRLSLLRCGVPDINFNGNVSFSFRFSCVVFLVAFDPPLYI